MMSNENEVDLGHYKGLPIESTKIVVKKLGDGLSKAVSVEPVIHELDGTVYIVVRARKTRDRYEVITDRADNAVAVVLVQEFDANAAHFSDTSTIAKSIDRIVAKIQKFESETKGQLVFDTTDLSDDDLPKRAKSRRGEFGDLPDKVDEAMKGEN